MDEEGNETLLMKYCPSTGGESPCWLIRQGHDITLGELFFLVVHRCDCWKLYRTYRTLDIFICKKVHSVSGSEEAVCQSHAKRKRHYETGRWRLQQ